MKRLVVMSAIAMSGLFYQTANAQIGVHFNINLGPRPVVVQSAPVYDEDYYYLPEVEAYYSVNQHCYYYQDGGRWISAAYLPGVYRNYDWQHANHYAVREARPYLHNDVYRARYGGFDGRRDWNRDDRRVYADRGRVADHNQYRGNDYGRNPYDNRGGNFGNHSDRPQNDNRGNYGGRNDRQQPQQNDNRGGNYGGGRNDNQQPQQNDNRGGNNSGRNDNQQSQPQGNDRGGNHGNDNNRGGNDNRQGRSGRS